MSDMLDAVRAEGWGTTLLSALVVLSVIALVCLVLE